MVVATNSSVLHFLQNSIKFLLSATQSLLCKMSACRTPDTNISCALTPRIFSLSCCASCLLTVFEEEGCRITELKDRWLAVSPVLYVQTRYFSCCLDCEIPTFLGKQSYGQRALVVFWVVILYRRLGGNQPVES